MYKNVLKWFFVQMKGTFFYILTQCIFSQEFSNKVKYFKSDWWQTVTPPEVFPILTPSSRNWQMTVAVRVLDLLSQKL